MPQHHAVVVIQGTVVVVVGGVEGTFNDLAKDVDAYFVHVHGVKFEAFLQTSIICYEAFRSF